MNEQEELDRLNTFSVIMQSVLKELEPEQEKVVSIYMEDISEKEKYLKIFELYLDKTIK